VWKSSFSERTNVALIRGAHGDGTIFDWRTIGNVTGQNGDRAVIHAVID
jgi:hypothetical protein